MRLSQPPNLLSLLAVILSSTHIAQAKPFRRGDSLIETDNQTLVERQGSYACGYGPLTCETADACYTDANGQAQCHTSSSGTQEDTADSGQWQLYTTTYTTNELTTITSSNSLPVSVTTQVATGGTCDTAVGESPCGTNPANGEPLCCATGQQCLYQGQCGSSGGGGGDVSSSYLFSVTATGTAFIRPTSATTQTVTSTGSATTTVPYQSASPTSSSGSAAGMQSTTSNNGLSGGAIAGIVIGVLLGILLLLLICGCLCFKGLLDSFLALLGLGPKRKRRESTYIEERHSHHASGGGGGGGGRTWFGQRPSRPEREKRSGGIGGLGAVAGGLTALAVVLGLKRRIDRRDKTSYTTGSSYTYSDYTSSSE